MEYKFVQHWMGAGVPSDLEGSPVFVSNERLIELMGHFDVMVTHKPSGKAIYLDHAGGKFRQR